MTAEQIALLHAARHSKWEQGISLTDPNTILHYKTMILFAALYCLDIIHLLLDASGRAAAQMTNTDSHNGEDNTPDVMEE